jgi:hypothetical protein
LRTEAVQKDLESQKYGPVHNVSEIMTLSVKDVLPNLSEELKKYDGKEIESEAKPDVVYYSEGYEVSTINVHDELPNLEKEKNKKNVNAYRPSDKEEIAATGYDVSTIEVSNVLPDLEDVKKNPEKYMDKPDKTVVIDEDSLLKSLSNVSFKPFYEEENEKEAQIDIKHPLNDTQEPEKEKKTEDNVEENQNQNSNKPQLCSIDDKTYNIISDAPIDDEKGCYLANNGNEYVVVGYIKNATIKIKTYENLKSKKIQIRLNEILKDGTEQYLVKIGLNKFILNVTKDSMCWVMDLC